jgi:hypothetical protein
VPEDAGAETIQRKNAEAGLVIDARTAVPGWGGERADYTYLLTMLEQRKQRRGAGVERAAECNTARPDDRDR